jgi:hypothetical protein
MSLATFSAWLRQREARPVRRHSDSGKPLSIRSVITKLSSHLMRSGQADRGITRAVFSSFNVAG